MAEKVTIGNCELWHGDALDVLPLLPPVDLVLTDPPYGMNLDTDYSGIDRGLGKVYDKVHGDNEPFDPRPFLIGKEHVFWGAQYFCHSLPDAVGRTRAPAASRRTGCQCLRNPPWRARSYKNRSPILQSDNG